MSTEQTIQDCGVFVAQLSTGDWLLEHVHLAGALSPWQVLMERCQRQHLHVTDLRLNCGGFVVETRPHAPAYFFAVKMFRGVGINAAGGADELAYKGVGWVTDDRQRVEIIWASRRLLAKCQACGFAARIEAAIEPRPCERCKGGTLRTAPDAWRETRPVRGNLNLIWSNPAEGGRERDVVVRDGRLWIPGPRDAAQQVGK